MGLGQTAAGRTLSLSLLLQHGVEGETGLRLYVMQDFAPNVGSAISSVCAPQLLGGGAEEHSGSVFNYFWCQQSRGCH